jgi:hypothetical protein
MREWALKFREALACFDDPNHLTDELLKTAVGWRNLALYSEAQARKKATPSRPTANREAATAGTDALTKYLLTVNC